MADDDWDLPDDGEINSDPEDITLKPKVLPKFQLNSSKKSSKKSGKKSGKKPPPFNSVFECTYPSNEWEIIQIQPMTGKSPQDVRYELVKDVKYLKLQVVVGIKVQCYWLCTEIKPGVFDAWYYECERIIFGSQFFNPFTGENDDGIFGPTVYGDIVFGHKWEFVTPRFKQHIQML
tara:strand:+ start:26144 stop:26671 length:528 start_codon:yes stop_codon:yes gene_type:complete